MTAKGREIVASLAEAIAVERAGIPIESRFTVRTVDCQTIFAELLGVSAVRVRAWEQGQRQPAKWA